MVKICSSSFIHRLVVVNVSLVYRAILSPGDEEGSGSIVERLPCCLLTMHTIRARKGLASEEGSSPLDETMPPSLLPSTNCFLLCVYLLVPKVHAGALYFSVMAYDALNSSLFLVKW